MRERAERRPAGRRLARRLGDRPRSGLGAFGLDGLDQRRRPAPGLVLGQLPGRRPTVARPPATGAVRHDPRPRAEPPPDPLAVGAPPLDRPHRLAAGLERLDQQERRRQRVVSGHRGATLHPTPDGRTTGGPALSGGPAGGPICRDFTASERDSATSDSAYQSQSARRSTACHAEGRGFESLHPLVTEAPLLAGFLRFRGCSELERGPRRAGRRCLIGGARGGPGRPPRGIAVRAARSRGWRRPAGPRRRRGSGGSGVRRRSRPAAAP